MAKKILMDTGDMSEEKKIAERTIDYLKQKFENGELNENNRFNQFTSVDEEYQALRKGVGLRDISSNAVIEFVGEDILNFLNRITTNEVAGLGVNKTIKTLFTNSGGGVLGRTSLLNLEERTILLGSFQNNQRLSQWIRNFITNEKIKISDLTGQYLLFEIYGPQADSYLSILCGKELDELELHGIKTFNAEGFIFHLIKTLDAAGNQKYWLMLLNQDSEKFIDLLFESTSVFDVKMVGETAFNIFRVEEGIPVIPFELNGNFKPDEANLMEEVSLNKETFVGYDAVARKNQYQVSRKLKGFFLDDHLVETLPLALYNAGGEEAAVITSAACSKLLNKSIGMGYIFNEDANNLTDIELYDKSKNRKVFSITNLPFKK